MKNFQIDESQGPHAASGLSDEMLDYLHRVISLELAIRMKAEDFGERFRTIVESRLANEPAIRQLRAEREAMLFVAEVQADLERLPLTTDQEPDQSFGMYL